MAMSADELDRRFTVELAWFEEHCPNPRQWMDEHGWSPQSVWDYISEHGPGGQ
jgi:hypothetical protein